MRTTRFRKDRAYAFEARLSSLDGAGCSEPGGTDRELLRYSGAEPLELAPGDGVLVPVEREVQSSADGSLTEAVFPGCAEGFVLLAAQELDYTLEPGDVVAEVRSGLVETAAWDCGAVETTFLSPGEDGPCETCGVAKAPELSEGCFSCGSAERTAVRSYQGCSSCSRTCGRRSACTRVGVFSVLAAVTALFGGGSYERPVEDPSVVIFLGSITHGGMRLGA